MKTDRPWTDEEKIKCKVLWQKSGLSAAAIGKELGRNRNSVIGFAHKNNFGPKIRTNKVINWPKQISKRPLGRKPIGTSLFDAKEGQCREVIGDPRFMIVCGKPIDRGMFCKCHADKNYETPKFKEMVKS